MNRFVAVHFSSLAYDTIATRKFTIHRIFIRMVGLRQRQTSHELVKGPLLTISNDKIERLRTVKPFNDRCPNPHDLPTRTPEGELVSPHLIDRDRFGHALFKLFFSALPSPAPPTPLFFNPRVNRIRAYAHNAGDSAPAGSVFIHRNSFVSELFGIPAALSRRSVPGFAIPAKHGLLSAVFAVIDDQLDPQWMQRMSWRYERGRGIRDAPVEPI